MEWQWTDMDPLDWIFGEKVRGLVRNPVAEIYYDEDRGWVWLIHGKQRRGLAGSLHFAVAAVERELGIE